MNAGSRTLTVPADNVRDPSAGVDAVTASAISSCGQVVPGSTSRASTSMSPTAGVSVVGVAVTGALVAASASVVATIRYEAVVPGAMMSSTQLTLSELSGPLTSPQSALL